MDSNVLQHLDRQTFKPGELLFQEGDLTTFFYIVESGEIEIFTRNPQGQKVQLSVVKEGEPLGEFAMITKKARSANAAALTQVTAYKVSEEGYKKLMSEIPFWAQMMIKNLINRLSDSTDTIRFQSSKK